MQQPRTVVFIRHAESAWNLENRFSGWADMDLSDGGVREAREAGERLRAAGFLFHQAYTSLLKRAIRTLWLVLEVVDQCWVPEIKNWRLNERSYGALEGLNKKEVADKFGTEQLHRWRRGYRDHPPLLEWDDPRHPRFDPRYRDIPPEELPRGESLADTEVRAVQYWNTAIVPQLREPNTLLVVAHGNTLRALFKYFRGLGDKEVEFLEVPTGLPVVYTFDERMSVMDHYSLGGDPMAAEGG